MSACPAGFTAPMPVLTPAPNKNAPPSAVPQTRTNGFSRPPVSDLRLRPDPGGGDKDNLTDPVTPCDFLILGCGGEDKIGCMIGHCVCADRTTTECFDAPPYSATNSNPEFRQEFTCAQKCEELDRELSYVSLPCRPRRNGGRDFALDAAAACQLTSTDSTGQKSFSTVQSEECGPTFGVCHKDFPYAFSPARNFSRCCSVADAWVMGDKKNAREDISTRGETCFGREIACGFPPCMDFPRNISSQDGSDSSDSVESEQLATLMEDLTFYNGLDSHPNGSRITLFMSGDESCEGFVCETPLSPVVEGGCYSPLAFQPNCSTMR